MNNPNRPITNREKEVLYLIAHEHSTKEIASKLYVSYETACTHRKNIMNKLGAKNTAGVVRMAFERGLMHVGRMAFLFILLYANYSHAQGPNNAGQYNYQIRTHSFAYAGLCGTELVPMQPAFLFKAAYDVNGVADHLMPFLVNTSSDEDFCHNWAEQVTFQLPLTTDDHNEILISRIRSQNTKADVDVQSFNNNVLVTDVCQFDDEVFGEDCFFQREKRLINPVDSGGSNYWNSHTIKFPTNASCTIQSVWRYSNGDILSEAFDFGTINLDDRSHKNATNIAPSGALSSMGYSNSFTPQTNFNFDNSPDVVYQFTIINNAKNVSITASTGAVGYDNKIHLLAKSGSGYLYIAHSADDPRNASIIKADLGAGDYYVVVEGWNGTSGFFTLDIPAPPAAQVNPGSIAQPNTNFYCALEEDWPGINSAVSASPIGSNYVNLGTYIYQWQYMANHDGNWIDLPNTNSSNMPAGLDVMTENDFDFRRKVSIGGNVAYSNIVSISYKTQPLPGSIALSGTSPIITGQVPGVITSVNDGTGPGEPPFYSWFRSTDGSTYSNIFINTKELAVPALFETTWYRRDISSGCDNTTSVQSNIVKIEVELPITCGNIPSINCGETISGNNSTGTNAVETWCNITSESAPELLYKFEAYTDNNVQIDLTGLTGDLDMFLLDDCESLSCIASSLSLNSNPEKIDLTLSAGTYYIVIDGFQGITSDFMLTLTSCGASLVDCDSEITLSSPSDDYNTGSTIKSTNLSLTASNKISGNATITYSANMGTTLKENFEITPSGQLTIDANGCP